MKASLHVLHHGGKKRMTLVSSTHMVTNVTGAREKQQKRYFIVLHLKTVSQATKQWVEEILDPYLE